MLAVLWQYALEIVSKATTANIISFKGCKAYSLKGVIVDFIDALRFFQLRCWDFEGTRASGCSSSIWKLQCHLWSQGSVFLLSHVRFLSWVVCETLNHVLLSWCHSTEQYLKSQWRGTSRQQYCPFSSRGLLEMRSLYVQRPACRELSKIRWWHC